MPQFSHSVTVNAPADSVWRWYSSPGAFGRVMGEGAKVYPISVGALAEGTVAEFKFGVGPFRVRWRARHHGVIPPDVFCDTMEVGPFSRWVHEHRLKSEPDGCEIIDSVDWSLRPRALDWSLRRIVERRLLRVFSNRSIRVATDLARIEQFADRPRQKVLVSGSTGLIGSQLCAFLSMSGHEVTTLVREGTELSAGERSYPMVCWDDTMGLVTDGDLNGFDTVIHLAGAPIAERRWTRERRRLILESRVTPTRNLVKLLTSLDRPPKTLISGSAIGIYGNRKGETITEDSSLGDGFLADVCQQWEAAALTAVNAGIRVVNLRTGLVLTSLGGLLSKLLMPAKFGLNGPVGGGDQYYSWISLDDQIYAISHLMMTERCEGPFNLTAPQAVPQKQFAKSLGGALGRSAGLPAPGFLVGLLLGELGRELVLGGQNVAPNRLIGSGFDFVHRDLKSCLGWVAG